MVAKTRGKPKAAVVADEKIKKVSKAGKGKKTAKKTAGKTPEIRGKAAVSNKAGSKRRVKKTVKTANR